MLLASRHYMYVEYKTVGPGQDPLDDDVRVVHTCYIAVRYVSDAV